MTKFTVKVTTSYKEVRATFLSAGNESQPVVEIDKQKVSSSDEITIKSYDLSLRKFITSINGVAPQPSRVPVISGLSDMKNEKITTAVKTQKTEFLQPILLFYF